MSPLEEIPGMVKLDAPQPGEVVVLVFGVEGVVCYCRCEKGSNANGTSDEPIVLPAD